MTPLNLTHQFDMIFTTSFKHTSSVLYLVEFENSNVVETVEKLKILRDKVANKISTGKHVGAPIYTADVELALNTLKEIIDYYKTITGVTELSEGIKIYTMINHVRSNERTDVKTLAKEVIAEVLKPEMELTNLSKKEKIKLGAEIKSQERKMESLKRQEKQ
ncbi:hypothetical protein FLCH110379_20915 [Flavobacterium chungbukense]